MEISICSVYKIYDLFLSLYCEFCLFNKVTTNVFIYNVFFLLFQLQNWSKLFFRKTHILLVKLPNSTKSHLQKCKTSKLHKTSERHYPWPSTKTVAPLIFLKLKYLIDYNRALMFKKRRNIGIFKQCEHNFILFKIKLLNYRY